MEQNKKVMERFVEFINTGNMEIGPDDGAGGICRRAEYDAWCNA